MSLPFTVLWWHWIVLGLLLLAAEIAAAGGFYVMFFGIGALVVGLLSLFDLAGSLPTQLLLFTALSLATLALFRGRLLAKFQRDPQAPAVDALVGEVGVALEPITPGAVGKIELRGTPWSAKNVSTTTDLEAGGRCRVIRVDGLTLHVKPEGAHA